MFTPYDSTTLLSTFIRRRRGQPFSGLSRTDAPDAASCRRGLRSSQMAHSAITARALSTQLRNAALEAYNLNMMNAQRKSKLKHALRPHESMAIALSSRKRLSLTHLLFSLSENQLGRVWELTMHRAALAARQPSVDHGCECCDLTLHRSHVEAKARRLTLNGEGNYQLNVNGLPTRPSTIVPTLVIRPDTTTPEVLWLDGRWIRRNGGTTADGKMQVTISPTMFEQMRQAGRVWGFKELASRLNLTCNC